jgi:SAM-dependent methyltransferase
MVRMNSLKRRHIKMTETRTHATPPANMLMLEMLAGFQVSQALYVAAKLDVATVLAGGPRTVREIAAAVNADAEALGRIIRFLATLGLYRTNGDQVELTELGATLAKSRDTAYNAALYWMETHYAPFGCLLDTARTGKNAAEEYYGRTFFEWIYEEPERVQVQNQAFAWVTAALRDGMFDGYRLPEGTVVADIGGADGSMMARLLADEPDRRGIVFDQPEVVTAAEKTLADYKLADRVQAVAGDFFQSVPAADVYILSYILHDWNDEESRRILRNIASAANPGARLVIVEAIIPPGDKPHPAKVIDLTMLAMNNGRERTAAEYTALLESAGFTLDRILPSPSMFSFTEATLR